LDFSLKTDIEELLLHELITILPECYYTQKLVYSREELSSIYNFLLQLSLLIAPFFFIDI